MWRSWPARARSSPAGRAGSGWPRPANSAAAGPGWCSPTSSGRRSTQPSTSCAPTGSRPMAWCATSGRSTTSRRWPTPRSTPSARVHIVFNNAGIAVGGPVLDMTHDDWRWVIDVDLWGPIHGVEAFLPRIVAQGEGGHVLFTASFAGLVPNRGLGPYCVAKYGVVALAEVLWRELREHGIGVSVLCPMRVGTQHRQLRAQPQRRLRRAGRHARWSPTRTPATTSSPAGARRRRRRRAHGRRHRRQPPVRAARTTRAGPRSAAASSASTGRSTSRPRPAPAVLRRRSSR